MYYLFYLSCKKNLGIQSVETKEEFHCTTENVSFMHMTINTLNWIELKSTGFKTT